MDDAETLRRARNAVLYGGETNPLVEWTLSDEWTSVCAAFIRNPCPTVIDGEIEAK